MYERILIPLDGSKVGETALPYVEELASKMSPEVKLEVTLLLVLSRLTHWVVAGETSAPVPFTEQELVIIKQRCMDYLEKTAEGLRLKKATVETKLSTGNAAEEIIRVADEMNADLIAMTTHGRSGFSRLAFGSVTEKVLRGANLPVLVVRVPKETEQT